MHMSEYLQRTGWGGDFSISSQNWGNFGASKSVLHARKKAPPLPLDPGLGGLFRALRATGEYKKMVVDLGMLERT